MSEKKKAGAPTGNRNAVKSERMTSRLNALSCYWWQNDAWVKAAQAKEQKLPDWVRDSLDEAAAVKK